MRRPMRATGSAPWTCTQCGRTVPAREPRCHCGLLRAESSAAREADETTSGVGGSFGRTVLGLALVAAAGYGLYAASLQREQRQQAAEAARQERIRLETAPRSGPTQGRRRPLRGHSLRVPRLRWEGRSASFERRGHTRGAKPGESGRLQPSRARWKRNGPAPASLEPPCRRYGGDGRAAARSGPFTYTCLGSRTELAGAPRRRLRGAGRPTANTSGLDCEFARELVARGNVLKAELRGGWRAHEPRPLRKLVETTAGHLGPY